MPLQAEPEANLNTFVREVLARRAMFREMEDELVKLIGGLVDQFAQVRQDVHFDPRSIKFDHIRWTREGQIVIDITHDRRRFYPREARPWS